MRQSLAERKQDFIERVSFRWNNERSIEVLELFTEAQTLGGYPAAPSLHEERRQKARVTEKAPSAPRIETVLITGDTYPVKEQLKDLGGRWDASSRGWRVPLKNVARAREIVELHERR